MNHNGISGDHYSGIRVRIALSRTRLIDRSGDRACYDARCRRRGCFTSAMSQPPRRPPSSASTRAGPSSASPFVRPSSSASTRPPSSASAVRPSSSASSVRPSSSAGSVRHLAPSRAESRATQRPSSRFSRPATRHSTRLNPLYQTLVTQLTGWTDENDEDDFNSGVELVTRRLDQTSRPAASADFATIDKQIRGLGIICLSSL